MAPNRSNSNARGRTRYQVKTQQDVETRVVTVTDDSGCLCWTKERYLTDDEIVEKIFDDAHQVVWSIHRPIDGWYIRIYPHPILSPPPRPSGVRESTQMLSNPTARTLRPIQFQSARNPKSPESLMFRMTLPTDVSARSGAPSSPTLPYSTSITIPPTPRSPRPNVDGAAPSSTLDLDPPISTPTSISMSNSASASSTHKRQSASISRLPLAALPGSGVDPSASRDVQLILLPHLPRDSVPFSPPPGRFSLMKFGDLLSLGDKGKNLSCVWKVGGGGGVGLGGENGEVEVFRYEDVPSFFSIATQGTLFLNEDVTASLGSVRSFWIAVALAYIEFLEEAEAYDAAKDG